MRSCRSRVLLILCLGIVGGLSGLVNNCCNGCIRANYLNECLECDIEHTYVPSLKRCVPRNNDLNFIPINKAQVGSFISMNNEDSSQTNPTYYSTTKPPIQIQSVIPRQLQPSPLDSPHSRSQTQTSRRQTYTPSQNGYSTTTTTTTTTTSSNKQSYYQKVNVRIKDTDRFVVREVKEIRGCVEQRNGYCVRCQPGWYVLGGICVQVNVNCKTYNQFNAACTSCFPGFLLSGPLCLRQIQSQNYQTVSPSPMIFQAPVPSPTRNRFPFIPSNSPYQPPSIPANMPPYQPPNLPTNIPSYKPATITTYQPPNPPPTPTPAAPSLQIPNCSQTRNNICVRCSFRFYKSGNECLKIDDQCRTWSQLNGDCTSCYMGYEIAGRACVLERRGQIGAVRIGDRVEGKMVENCQQMAYNSCVRCSFRYYLDKGMCRKISDSCKSWNQFNGACSSCHQGYNLYAGDCVSSPNSSNIRPAAEAQPTRPVNKPSIPNCDIEDGGVCRVCSNRYFRQGAACVKVDDNCFNWEQNGFCRLCYAGFQVFGGKCVFQGASSSVKRQSGQRQTQNVVTPIKPIQSVQRFQPSQQSQPTQKIQQTQQAQAIPQQVRTQPQQSAAPLISNCDEERNGQCIKCSFKYYKQNKGCRKVDDLCFTWDKQIGDCTSCYQPYQLIQGKCKFAVNILRQDRIPEQTSTPAPAPQPPQSSSTPSSPGCLQFKDSMCVRCEQSYIFVGGKCVTGREQCRTTDQQGCTSCQDGYQLVGSDCFQTISDQ